MGTDPSIRGNIASSFTAGVDEVKSKWVGYTYWGIGLLVILAGCYYLYNTMQRPVAAILMFIGGLISLYYYWVKWFELQDPMRWQPSMSPCPDYLTLIDPGNGTTTPARCADFIGVSANGLLATANINAPTQVPMGAVFEKYPNETRDVVCTNVQTKGLVWTGLCAED